jgi:hypothetical protein
MNKPSKEDLINKWSSILEKSGLTNSHWGNIEQLVENQSNQILEENTSATENTTPEFPNILPMAMKVAAKTIAMDLCFDSEEEINEVKSKVQSENRDGKIDAIIEGGEFVEKKLEDDPGYKELMKKGLQPLSAPSNQLFYLDFKYGDSKVETHKKTRRAGKKNKKKSND